MYCNTSKNTRNINFFEQKENIKDKNIIDTRTSILEIRINNLEEKN